MYNTQNELQNQTINPNKLGIFSNYFDSFNIGSLLNKSGITKTKGATPLAIFTIKDVENDLSSSDSTSPFF